MNPTGKILVADRNRHVREFLRRELLTEGYQMEEARDGREVLTMLNGPSPPDLLILDLELPYVAELKVLELLQEKLPSLPVIVHSFVPESETHLPETARFLEKKEDTDLLKKAVAELLEKNDFTAPTAARDKGG